MTPATDILFRVRVPERLRIQRCIVSAFGEPDREITFHRDDKGVSIHLPELHSYTIVSFTDGDSIETTQREAEKRRELDRVQVRQLAQQFDLY